GRANFKAGRVDAVLADVRHHEPYGLAAIGAELFDELDVPPVDVGKAARVVVTIAAKALAPRLAGPRGVTADAARVVTAHEGQAQAARWQTVPLVASDLTGFAANANRGIGVETHGFRHDGVSGGRRRVIAMILAAAGGCTSEFWFFAACGIAENNP